MSEQLEAWPAGQTATMNVTYTQANAAGGAVVCEISPGAGNEFIVMGVRAVNSGTNTVVAEVEPTTAFSGTALMLGNIASGATTALNMSIGSGNAASATTTNTATGLGYPVTVSGTMALRVRQTAAGAQSDTFQVLVNIRVKTGQIPTVTHANSTNPANVSVTAGAESFTVV